MAGFSERLSAMKGKQEASEQMKKEQAEKAAEAARLEREAKRSELSAERDAVTAEFAQAEQTANEAREAIAQADAFAEQQGENLDPEAKAEIDAMKVEAGEAQQKFEELKTKLDGLNTEISAFEESGESQETSTEAVAEVVEQEDHSETTAQESAENVQQAEVKQEIPTEKVEGSIQEQDAEQSAEQTTNENSSDVAESPINEVSKTETENNEAGLSSVEKENLTRDLLATEKYDEAMAMAESISEQGTRTKMVEYVKNTANSAVEEKAFAETFSEETTQFETLKNSVDSANTIEDLEATLKTAQSLRELTRNKLQGIQTEKGLSGESDSLNRLIGASRLNEMDGIVNTIRSKMGTEAEKATETFLVELNNEYNAFTKNIEQSLASVPETGSLEGLGLEELGGKLNELNDYQHKLDSMKSDVPLDAVRAIEDKQKNFEDEMKSWEEQGINIRFKMGEKSGWSNNRLDLWRRVDGDGAYEKAMEAQISLNEKAPTLVTPRIEAVKQAIDKFFSEYGTKIDTIATEYQKNKMMVETEEKGINDQITQLEASKGMFNKGKIETQIMELRKGLGKLDALKEQTRNQLKALEDEMDRLDNKTNGVYKDKFDILAKKRVQVWNSL